MQDFVPAAAETETHLTELNIPVPQALHESFIAACEKQRTTVTTTLLPFIKRWAKKHGS